MGGDGSVSYDVVSLETDLEEFVSGVRHHLRSDSEPHLLSARFADLWQVLPHSDYLVLFESQITAHMINAASKLNLTQLPQVGYDNVGVAAAAHAGVCVCNTPPGATAKGGSDQAGVLRVVKGRR
jgi:phosphoglycerate dehydrogenase-like enzyme